MLRYLEIKNIALIDRASIEFGPGLCVLTGETGAGKSIIIDSINAVLGAKAQKELVRAGTDGASVTAVFSVGAEDAGGQLSAVLRENGVGGDVDADVDGDSDDPGRAEAGEMILSREILPTGRNNCRVNGRLVASSVLRALGELAVDLHGQHDNHSLLKREKHIDLIDNFGGAALLAERETYAALFARRGQLKRSIAELTRSEAERVRGIDILNFQIDEIKGVRPLAAEDQRLEAEIAVLSNAERISKALETAYALLGGGGDGAGDSGGRVSPALESVHESLRLLNPIGQYDKRFSEYAAKLQEIAYLLEDVVSGLRAENDGDGYDPRRLDKLNERLDAIERLKRKYGGSIKAVHQFYRDAQRRLAELTNSSQTAKELEAELAGVERELTARAHALTKRRLAAAARVEEGVVRELVALEMKSARLNVSILSADEPDAFNAKGRDQVEFLFSANLGEDVKPLARIASGGEMSRVMLAIKSVLADADDIPTMIFDEIDAGISGNAASRVAEKMCRLSRGRQIICVTHLAQIACMADDQFLIEKTAAGNKTQTRVKMLSYGERVEEISRLLGGGAPTEASVRLSGELLDRAAAFKETV